MSFDFYEIQPLTEDKIYIKDDIYRKTNFDGRWPLMEGSLSWKTTFDGRYPLMEDDLWWKTIFDERQPSVEYDFQ